MSFPTAAPQPARCWVRASARSTLPFHHPGPSPLAEYPIRLHVAEGGDVSAAPREAIFGPWRVQPAVADLTGSGLPDLLTMDLELDLVSHYASACGRQPLSATC